MKEKRVTAERIVKRGTELMMLGDASVVEFITRVRVSEKWRAMSLNDRFGIDRTAVAAFVTKRPCLANNS